MNEYDIQTQLTQVCNALEPWRKSFPSEIEAINSLKADAATKLKRFSQEELHLSIGIMGQVKAGKSSFLNALLFDGQSILPEAATPKTANLTRITWGVTPTLTVTFYTSTEWLEIERVAASAGTSPEARVGRDLLAMVKRHQLDVPTILAQGSLHLPATDVTALLGQLNDYVGENGKFTPLVKMTELALPMPELNGYDIVDTPGMNDPVPSRTQKTREYMANCDVVFFLSRCSQFLDQSDMDLLARQLPGKGVKRMVLVAAQLDAALLDDGFDRDSLAATEHNLNKRLGQRALNEINKLADMRTQRGETSLADMLRKMTTPIFASTYAHGFAHWPKERWSQNSSMQNVHTRMTELANACWGGQPLTEQDWHRIGNFGELQAAFDAARQDKQALLQAQREGWLPQVQHEFNNRLQELTEAAQSRAAKLRKGDINELNVLQRACESRIHSIAARLSQVMDAAQQKAENTRRSMSAELQAGQADFSNLKTRTGTDTDTRSRQVSTSTWYKPWTWGDIRTVYTTVTKNYEYLATADAIDQVVNYSRESASNMEHAFRQVVSITTLRADLKRALLAELDTGSSGFDPTAFRVTFEGSLRQLKLPELVLHVGDAAQNISDCFNAEVRSHEMAKLRQALQKALTGVHQRLLAEFTRKVTELCQRLQAVSDALEQEMVKDLFKELNQLRDAFANKEQELQSYEKLIALTQSF
jgi:predicted GTPase